MAPAAGLEPATYWLTANRSTTELCRNTFRSIQTNTGVVKRALRGLFCPFFLKLIDLV